MDNKIYKKKVYNTSVPFAEVLKVKGLYGEEKYKFVDINNAFCNLLNETREEIINKSVDEVSNFKEILKSNTYCKAINNSNHKCRGNVELNDNIYNMEIIKGKNSEVYILLTKSENSNYKLSSLLRKSPFNAFIKDLEGRYTDVNRGFLQAIEKEYNEVVGKTHYDLWTEERVNEIIKQDNEVINKNKLLIFNEIIPIEKYKNKTFETAKWPCIENGKIVGVIGVSMEISDRLKVKEIIERTEENFLDLANNIDELIVIKDEKKALYISPYFEQLYGFKPDELYEDIDSWYKYWDKVEFVNEPNVYDYSGIDTNIFRVVKEGKIDKWIQSKFVPIFDEDGKIIRKIGFLKDVTEEKNTDEKLEELRMDFFANVSHELRTPINLIMTSMQLIDFKLIKDDKDYIQKYNDIINQNSYRLLRLVNNLIDITKINSGTFNYNPQKVNIIPFVEDIVLSLAVLIEKRNLSIVFDTDVEEKIISFDLSHLERILYNLICNAVKFNKLNGSIEVKISTNNGVKIIVKDTGIGIPSNEIGNLFNNIKQLDKHTKREGEGSGIGLSLVKSLVELNKGSIEVKSKEGVGSEFIIIIPDNHIDEDILNIEYKNYSLNEVNKIKIEFSDISW